MGEPSQMSRIGPAILRKSMRRKPTTPAASEEAGHTCKKSRPSSVMPLISDQVITGEWNPEHRRLSAGCPRANGQRQQVKSGFIYPDDSSPFLLSLPPSLLFMLAFRSRFSAPLRSLLTTAARSRTTYYSRRKMRFPIFSWTIFPVAFFVKMASS